MYISALIHSDWTCCYVHLSVIQPAPKHLEPISCLHCAFLHTVVPGSTGIHRYTVCCCKMSFWSINMIAGVPVKCTSNHSLKSIFVDKFIDIFFENWKYALLCHVGGVKSNLKWSLHCKTWQLWCSPKAAWNPCWVVEQNPLRGPFKNLDSSDQQRWRAFADLCEGYLLLQW